jgi:anti-anti-sigma factor
MLSVHTEEIGDVAVLHCEGYIVRGAETAALRSAVFSQSDASVVELDLSQVELIDAGGLGLLLELRKWAQTNRIDLILKKPRRLVHQVFKITCLDSVFDISFQEDALLCHA